MKELELPSIADGAILEEDTVFDRVMSDLAMLKMPTLTTPQLMFRPERLIIPATLKTPVLDEDFFENIPAFHHDE